VCALETSAFKLQTCQPLLWPPDDDAAASGSFVFFVFFVVPKLDRLLERDALVKTL
jgi:hypothetical protein